MIGTWKYTGRCKNFNQDHEVPRSSFYLLQPNLKRMKPWLHIYNTQSVCVCVWVGGLKRDLCNHCMSKAVSLLGEHLVYKVINMQHLFPFTGELTQVIGCMSAHNTHLTSQSSFVYMYYCSHSL